MEHLCSRLRSSGARPRQSNVEADAKTDEAAEHLTAEQHSEEDLDDATGNDKAEIDADIQGFVLFSCWLI